MKQVTMVLNHGELDILAEGLERQLRDDPKRRPDQWNRQLLEICLRWEGLKNLRGLWVDMDIFRPAWAIPYLRKALADASETPTLKLRVKELEARVKQLTKPKPKPKPKPKRLPAKVVPHAALKPAHPVPASVPVAAVDQVRAQAE